MTKNILITGSTDGVGKQVAMQLATDGHSVYVHGRNPQKVQAVINEIKAATKREDISGFVADLSDLNDVRKMAHDVAETMEHIDVLINNAGVYATPEFFNKDGLDLRYVVNYLAPYVLTEALLPQLRKADAPRIVNLSSAAQTTLSMEALRGERKLSQDASYAESKLALTMWSFDLAKREPNINIVAVNPGSLLNTKMAHEAYGRSFNTLEKGVSIVYALAIDNRYEGTSGKYYDNDRGGFGMAHPDAYDQGEVTKLLHTTQDLIKKY